MSLYAIDFAAELEKVLALGEECGFLAVEINSGNLHKRLGSFPGVHDRIQVCCDVMRQTMAAGDTVMREPPAGQEAALTIRYQLPRPI